MADKKPETEMSIRDMKREQLKKTAKKTELKDTLTKQLYEECKKEIQQKKAKNMESQRGIEKDDKPSKRQKNIFKMSRVLVTQKEKIKVSKAKLA